MKQRTELLEKIREILTNAGFYVSDLFSMRPVGFDLIARRDNSLLIIKVLTNIDAITEEVASELKKLSSLLKCSPLIVGEKSSGGTLNEDVVYDRFGLISISLDTLRNHLLEGVPLQVYAAPGGLYANLDNDRLIMLRKEKKLSRGSFARDLKVSRKTVQMYENGMNARVDVALKMEEVLDSSITSSIDILKHRYTERKKKTGEIDSINNLKSFQKEILSLLRKVGYKVIPVERCPFEAVSKDKKKIVLTCVNKYDKKLKRKAQLLGSISKIAEKHAVLITDKNVDKTNIEGTPLIIKEELSKIRGPEEIIELILERLYT